MIAWIIYHRDNAIYNKQYIQFYIDEGAKQGIEVKLLLVEDMEFGVRAGTWFLTYHKQELQKPDFAIGRAIYPLLSKQLECMGIPVFNNSFVAEICNDKARTYQYLAKTGIKMVDSSFYRNSQVQGVIDNLRQDTVIKAVAGHGGSQVFLVPEHQDSTTLVHTSIVEGLAGSDVVVQPLTGTRHQDLRVYVIGKDIIAAVLRTAKEGFKSNFSLGGEVRLYELKDVEVEIVQKIIMQFDFGLVGIDFIIGDEGELIFNEVEDVVGSRMLYQCSEINIVELYLAYIIERLRSS
ncbi:MAG: hypothetical protein K0R46_3400 [Herbinix sp.]|nr:hypothetical protein [Herbinix sp.]